jgi:zinc finger SWIM domain-containing protein 3
MMQNYVIQQVTNKIGQTLIVPKVGMTFESKDHAYEMYNNYAGKIGFSITKSTTKLRSDRTIYQKYIVCSGQRYGNTESSKGTTRLRCSARIQLGVSKKGIWTVQRVVLEHNHYLASPNKRKKLRSQ